MTTQLFEYSLSSTSIYAKLALPSEVKSANMKSFAKALFVSRAANFLTRSLYYTSERLDPK